jgi:hypothetical protein
LLVQDLGSMGDRGGVLPGASSDPTDPAGGGGGGGGGDGAPSANDAASAVEDAGVGQLLDGGDASNATDAGFDCSAVLEVAQLQPTTCPFVDPVSQRIADLHWVCAGGPARLALKDFELQGAVTGNTVEVSGCREDPNANFDGWYETITLSVDLRVNKGTLTFARAAGTDCARLWRECSATAGVTLRR